MHTWTYSEVLGGGSGGVERGRCGVLERTVGFLRGDGCRWGEWIGECSRVVNNLLCRCGHLFGVFLRAPPVGRRSVKWFRLSRYCVGCGTFLFFSFFWGGSLFRLFHSHLAFFPTLIG